MIRSIITLFFALVSLAFNGAFVVLMALGLLEVVEAHLTLKLLLISWVGGILSLLATKIMQEG